MGLTCTVLGCSGSYPGPGSACSGYLVRSAGVSLLLDAGSGTLANLQRHLPLADLDAVVVTHDHPDHWQDLEGLAVAAVYALDLPPVPVFSPAGLAPRLQGPARAFRWQTVADRDQVIVGGLSVTFSRTDHGPETLAVRVDGPGAHLGYSADSGPGWSLEALGPDLDLALCEATYLQDREGTLQHMSARQAGESARAARARRLVITHLQPVIDRDRAEREASEAYGGQVTVAAEGMVLEI